ncbi:MAG: V-type ATP synthase subunit E [Oscillospiraceae bacterium]|nr:V-type ATP synthase subunit E [Oscillospiraceae bacterium]
MNGIERLTARIQAEAEAENAAALESAQRQAEEILEKYRQSAEEEYSRLVEEAGQTASRQKEQLISAARLEAGKQVLITKQEQLQLAFDKAAEQLLALPADRYAELLVRLVVSASRTGKETILLNAADRKAYGEAVTERANRALAEQGRPAELTLAAETRNIDGGAVLKDGNIEVNCSLASLIEARREELSVETARSLFQ